MLTYTGYYHSCALFLCLLQHDVPHHATVCLVEMADRLIQQEKIKGLHQSSYHGNTLLLTKGHATYFGIYLIANPQSIKPLKYLLLRLKSSQFVLDLHILESCQFRKETQILKEQTQVVLPDLNPITHTKRTDVSLIEENPAQIILTMSDDVAEKTTFPCTAVGLDKNVLSSLEEHVVLPNFTR